MTAPADDRPHRRHRFGRIAIAGIFFQGGAAAVDTATVIAALTYGLTGSTFAVGAAAAIARYGWLFPQIFVAYFAQRRRRRMGFYRFGALGRVGCLGAAAVLLSVTDTPTAWAVVGGFFLLWTLYAFIGGFVAVPYNDIVARSVAANARSRVLAVRFFGGGLLALAVAAIARPLLDSLAFPIGHAAILALGGGLMLISALSFMSAGEPAAPPAPATKSFGAFLWDGVAVFRNDPRFRLFVYARWLAGLAAMALPFYVVVAGRNGLVAGDIALLLGAQTAGGLATHPLWGWWGDRLGKRQLLQVTAALSMVAPLMMLAWIGVGAARLPALPWFMAIFFLLGAATGGSIIALLGYLMHISPDHRRPAYSGYFNALVAPATLSPLLGALLAQAAGLQTVFIAAATAACLYFLVTRRLRS